ncbi:coenzyme Q-binding protein COQ10, mitochondrial [Diplogelasinospora grovesii]|uniref:Coenzyme Q-binding protein COQ10, mitochondrial n=1 Tax=Diplogelasinospora grovesii TaxID=303347 RepID=A0AAN6NHU6_9PEZI|nr:coenzyme Q-binding protein COQ10, mitochondrial [Diplogelasinospora grovesii]
MASRSGVRACLRSTSLRACSSNNNPVFVLRNPPLAISCAQQRRLLSSTQRKPQLPQPPSLRYAQQQRQISSFLSSLASQLPNNLPGSPSSPQTISARQRLPYSPPEVFKLIADVDSYASFLPHCTESRVTAWTPEIDNNKWPQRADLTVGWGPFTQSYTSRVYCIPSDLIVEAISGRATINIPATTLQKYGYPSSPTTTHTEPELPGAGIFESLVTRWTVTPFQNNNRGEEGSEVTLSVQFQFANPALGFAVSQLAQEKVTEMVAAFEERARKLYGRR